MKTLSFTRQQSVSWVVLHSLLMAFGLASLVTGLRIATQTRPGVLQFSALLPQGYVHGWHIVSAVGLLSVLIAYLAHLYFFRAQRLQIKRGASRYHRVVFWLGRLLVLTSLVSGCLVYLDVFMLDALVQLHYLAALGWLVYLAIHGGVYFVQYGWLSFKRIVTSHRVHPGRDGAVLATALVSFAIATYLVDASKHHDLMVLRIPGAQAVRIDGVADEPAWGGAEPVTINTIGGRNFVNGQTPVTIRALHNGIGVFFHIVWDDPSMSLQHLPLVKTAQGWKVTESGFYRFDELEHYEDKFAVLVSDNCEFGGSETAFLGPRPLRDKPPNWHGKGYHYVTDGEVRDLWHWKAVRTNDMFLADDNLIGAPDTVREGSRRYTAGYLADPRESGAYWMNWKWYRPGGIVPRRMPKRPGDLESYQAGEAGSGHWYIHWYNYDQYDVAEDRYPIGTAMPSVLYMSNRFEGDRADVYAHGKWTDGQWSLELMRFFDTGSEWDVALDEGVCLWVAAFDHAQVAHTRHVRPIRLHFGQEND